MTTQVPPFPLPGVGHVDHRLVATLQLYALIYNQVAVKLEVTPTWINGEFLRFHASLKGDTRNLDGPSGATVAEAIEFVIMRLLDTTPNRLDWLGGRISMAADLHEKLAK